MSDYNNRIIFTHPPDRGRPRHSSGRILSGRHGAVLEEERIETAPVLGLGCRDLHGHGHDHRPQTSLTKGSIRLKHCN